MRGAILRAMRITITTFLIAHRKMGGRGTGKEETETFGVGVWNSVLSVVEPILIFR